MSATVIGTFPNGYERLCPFFFVPLIQATAGNVGVQSSAIVVQGLAKDTIKGEILKRLFKEFVLGLVNGVAIALCSYHY